jgi:hypothetical protein
MQSKEIAPGIKLWENFLTDEEHEYLINTCRSLTQKDWESTYMSQFQYNIERDGKEPDNDWKDRIYQFPKDHPVIVSINKKINDFVKEDGEFPGLMCRSQRHYPGSFLKEHYDAVQSDSLSHAMVLYLNDDYIGGELYFKKFNIEFRPPVRSLIKFPSNEDYKHGINLVNDGPDRFVLTSFIWNNIESARTGR